MPVNGSKFVVEPHWCFAQARADRFFLGPPCTVRSNATRPAYRAARM